MFLRNHLGGKLRIRCTGADITGSLTAISRAGLSVYDGEIVDELNAIITLKRSEYLLIKEILDRKGDSVEIIEHKGFYWKVRRLMKRPVLVLSLFFLFVMNIYLPGRIFFIQVEGNTNIPTRQILEVASNCGLKFGTIRRNIRSEQIKNKLLEEIPQLQWTGVNTNGCVAVISVRERQRTTEPASEKSVSSIVASRDGVVVSCTVTKGSPVCKIGQAVKAGEVLISGYTDCGLIIQATQASGDVYAKTERAAEFVIPGIWQLKSQIGKMATKFSFIIGKKRINLYNGSGISPPSCGKMYSEMYLTLPGGFVLPVCVIKETWISCELTDTQLNANKVNEQLSQSAVAYLSDQMIAGQILHSAESFDERESVYHMKGKYACLEMIGQERKEEVYGEHQ